MCVLHSETATGCLSPIGEIRKAIDAAGHPAPFLVDTISSLASADYRHDERGVDVTIGGAQKGLMLPPGMSFNAVSEKALHASKTAKLPRSFFQWDDMLTMYKQGFFPYTPATQMLYGLDVSIQMLTRKGSTMPSPVTIGWPKRRAARAWIDPCSPIEILFAERYRGAAAGRPRCGSVPQHRQYLQYRLRCELRPVCEEIFPHRPYG